MTPKNKQRVYSLPVYPVLLMADGWWLCLVALLLVYIIYTTCMSNTRAGKPPTLLRSEHTGQSAYAYRTR